MSVNARQLVLLGPPGAGKGTQAEKLSARLEIPHISTGKILRDEIERGSKTGREAQGYMDQGQLVPDELIQAIVTEQLKSDSCRGGFILDGFPRSLAQAEGLGQAEGVTHLRVISLAVPEDELVTRMRARGRSDDKEDVVRHRLDVYRRQTQPLLDYYRERDALIEVDGLGDVDEVFSRMVGALDAADPQGGAA